MGGGTARTIAKRTEQARCTRRRRNRTTGPEVITMPPGCRNAKGACGSEGEGVGACLHIDGGVHTHTLGCQLKGYSLLREWLPNTAKGTESTPAATPMPYLTTPPSEFVDCKRMRHAPDEGQEAQRLHPTTVFRMGFPREGVCAPVAAMRGT